MWSTAPTCSSTPSSPPTPSRVRRTGATLGPAAPLPPDTRTEISVQTTSARQYWRHNLRYLVILLTIWATVSFGFGILLVEPLNRIRIGGFQLGFWFAQQGSIYIFVLLIVVYVILMNRLDRRFAMDDRGEVP
ncbi:MAG: DUF4212 domain-containing protein [Gemmatimonadales bacterium]|nr:DUF4212 domain-containing protein [Gemmatimonadales bacterium]